MSAYQMVADPPGLAAEDSYSQAQIELIWDMGLASLESNNGELVLPQHLESYLTESQINDLKLRLSRHLGAPTIAFGDQESQVFRIMRVPSLKSGENYLSLSPAQSSYSSTVMKASTPTYKAKAHIRKAKVPRPPNAFILYRQERHPVLKAEHPEYHNNDISVILGKQWKSESDEVKARYKKRADDIKAKHMQDHPDYQYAPRKPSEKKRRMTARRAAELARAEDTSIADLGSDEDVSQASSPAMPDVSTILGTNIPKHAPPYVKYKDGNLGITLPTHNTPALHGMLSARNEFDSTAGHPFDPSNHHQLDSRLPGYVENDQDFADSLVDWDGFVADCALATGASPEELAQLGGVELGNDYLSLSDEDQRTLFEAELERTMRYFQ